MVAEKSLALRNVILALSLVSMAVVAFQQNMGMVFPISDAFHKGEFLAAAMAALRPAPFEGDAFTIHGAADIWPALIVSLLTSSHESVPAYTVVIYPFLSLATVILVCLTAFRLAKICTVDKLALVPFFVIVPFCVGWRDLFFGLSLFMFAQVLGASRTLGWTAFVRQLLFGLVIALGTYWSFNRGAAALAAFGPVILYLAYGNRSHLVSITTAIAAFLALGLLLPGASMSGYFENLLMLLDTADQWTKPASFESMFWTVAIMATCGLSAIVAALSLRNGDFPLIAGAVKVALIIAIAVYAKIALGRIDAPHIRMGLWLPLLLVCLSLPKQAVSLPSSPIMLAAILLCGVVLSIPNSFGYMHHVIALTIILAAASWIFGARIRQAIKALVAVMCIATVGAGPVMLLASADRGQFDWLLSLQALPKAEDMAAEGVAWSAVQLIENDASCVFDLSNSGLINAVAKLPSCSRFTYPVYATARYEDRLIDDLASSAPPLVVYRSDTFSYAIDGQPMDERFPRLDREIARDFPEETCRYGFCLRFRE